MLNSEMTARFWMLAAVVIFIPSMLAQITVAEAAAPIARTQTAQADENTDPDFLAKLHALQEENAHNADAADQQQQQQQTAEPRQSNNDLDNAKLVQGLRQQITAALQQLWVNFDFNTIQMKKDMAACLARATGNGGVTQAVITACDNASNPLYQIHITPFEREKLQIFDTVCNDHGLLALLRENLFQGNEVFAKIGIRSVDYAFGVVTCAAPMPMLGKTLLFGLDARDPNLVTGYRPHVSPHFAMEKAAPNSPAVDTASLNFCKSGKSRCSGMFGIRS